MWAGHGLLSLSQSSPRAADKLRRPKHTAMRAVTYRDQHQPLAQSAASRAGNRYRHPPGSLSAAACRQALFLSRMKESMQRQGWAEDIRCHRQPAQQLRQLLICARRLPQQLPLSKPHSTITAVATVAHSSAWAVTPHRLLPMASGRQALTALQTRARCWHLPSSESTQWLCCRRQLDCRMMSAACMHWLLRWVSGEMSLKLHSAGWRPSLRLRPTCAQCGCDGTGNMDMHDTNK